MNDQFWWIENGVPQNEGESGCVRASVRDKFKNYSKMRGCVWQWFRSRAGNKKLSPASKLCLWAVCERFRWETFSSHDAYRYYGAMTGLSAKTVGRCVTELVKDKYLWVAVEGERRLLSKAIPGVRKHLLLVGLGSIMIKELKDHVEEK
tara:strand:+ start:45 stop:491 length:447 start_codon:yes stop_codon:yes gene_type:complete